MTHAGPLSCPLSASLHHLSTCVSVYVSVYLSVYLPIYLSSICHFSIYHVCLSVYLSIHLPIISLSSLNHLSSIYASPLCHLSVYIYLLPISSSFQTSHMSPAPYMRNIHIYFEGTHFFLPSLFQGRSFPIYRKLPREVCLFTAILCHVYLMQELNADFSPGLGVEEMLCGVCGGGGWPLHAHAWLAGGAGLGKSQESRLSVLTVPGKRPIGPSWGLYDHFVTGPSSCPCPSTFPKISLALEHLYHTAPFQTRVQFPWTRKAARKVAMWSSSRGRRGCRRPSGGHGPRSSSTPLL